MILFAEPSNATSAVAPEDQQVPSGLEIYRGMVEVAEEIEALMRELSQDSSHSMVLRAQARKAHRRARRNLLRAREARKDFRLSF